MNRRQDCREDLTRSWWERGVHTYRVCDDGQRSQASWLGVVARPAGPAGDRQRTQMPLPLGIRTE